MKVIKFNVSKAGRVYKDNQGNEKTNWDSVGTITEFHKDDGSVSRILEIPAIGLNASIFPIMPRPPITESAKAPSTKTTPSADYPDGLDVSEIPF